MTLAQAAAAMGALGDIGTGADTTLAGVCTDSRLVRPGELFFCLAGENFDGHEFAGRAVGAGALAVVATRPLPEIEGRVPVFMVRDVLEALGALGAAWRAASKATVVAVTGSAGKTTTKEMLACILERLGDTGKNYKNHNNQLGVPLCMLGLTGRERFWVLELGISQPRDMDELAAMVRPDVAVVTNIGPAHLEGLGGLEGVARHKSDVFKYLAPGGTAVASVDYPLLWERARELAPGAVGFTARDAAAPYAGSYLGPDGRGGGRFALSLCGDGVEFSAPFTGRYFAENMAAAAAVAHGLGATAGDVVAGIKAAGVPEHRFQVMRAGAWTVIDDTYNANPLSMRNAVDNAGELAGDGPLVLVLGEMKELGPGAADLHRELGEHLAASKAAAVFWHQGQGDAVAEGLARGGCAHGLRKIGDPRDLRANLKELELAGGVMLVKGSRSCRMERFVSAMTDAAGEDAE
ncbi:UDP-N-acetylmuramoyl-tripeptide--D-alanyl-D-alanine ligase [Desulfocurvus sp. DL9XJH121]